MATELTIYQRLGMKDRQEDSFAVIPEIPGPAGPLLAAGVFDGVGGSEDGDIAASRAASTFQSAIRARVGMQPRPTAKSLLLHAMTKANGSVLMLRKLHRRLRDGRAREETLPAAVGTVAVLCRDGGLVVGSIGDTRAFLLHGGTLVPITEIHNETTDAAAHARALGGTAVTRFFGQIDFRPQILTGRLGATTGEVWLMTDGAYEPLACSQSPDDPVRFFREAEEQSFWDNATAIRLAASGFLTPVAGLRIAGHGADTVRPIAWRKPAAAPGRRVNVVA